MNSQIPQYCLECPWIFYKAGACHAPDTYYIFSLISFIPYSIIMVFILLSIFSRKQEQVKIAGLLVSAYVIADRIIKNLVADPRPAGACKPSYGFPSSHMVVMCCYALYMLPKCKPTQKLFLIFLVITQAFARIHLHYHTLAQVIAGFIYSLLYTPLFNILYSKIRRLPILKKVYNLVGVKQQQTTTEKESKNKKL